MSDTPAPTPVHRYATEVGWRGSTGVGYESYVRNHTATAPPAHAALELSSDPAFRGDPSRLNPEQLLVLAASSCQLLSFLAIAARARIDVISYSDVAEGLMPEDAAPMSITHITLRPNVVVALDAAMPDTTAIDAKVRRLLLLAHKECYVASSLRTDIILEPIISFAPGWHDVQQ